MALADLTDPGAVREAIAEFDRLGREEFLAKYGFSAARDYFVVVDGKRYDSKAIAGVAHLHQHGTLLTAGEFSGGDSTVANKLEKLGLKVTRRVTLPDWSVDELMLALDLYLRTRNDISYSPTAPPVVELSGELRSLRVFPAKVRQQPRFRNANSVAMKLHNFAAIDPDHEGMGMAHGGVGDRRVWEEWAHRPDKLSAAVALIRERGLSDESLETTGEDEEYEAPEGQILFREHRRYERDRKLVAKKKASVRAKTGRLACEVCDFESTELYDIPGVIDVHHVVPLHQIGASVTTLEDLALVCPTCHRVLHKHRPIISPAELRARRTVDSRGL